jgi:hypothetical protein
VDIRAIQDGSLVVVNMQRFLIFGAECESAIIEDDCLGVIVANRGSDVCDRMRSRKG